MTRNEILKKIGALAKRIASTVAEIQSIAVSIVLHAVQHGDVTLADELLAACGKGIRRASLTAWFELNGPFILVNGKFLLNKERRAKMTKIPAEELAAKLAAILWQDAKPEPKLESVLDCAEQIEKFLARVAKNVKDAPEEVTVKNRELLELLVQTKQLWHAKQIMAAARPVEGNAAKRAMDDATRHTGETPITTPASMMHMIQQQ